MKPSRSLMDIMNEMAARPEFFSGRRKQARPKDQKAEVAAFIAVDPLLAELHKHHLDAKNDLKRLIKKNGLHDPMVDVARDMADSTLSAFETRLIEAQLDKYLRRLAYRKMKELEEEEAAEEAKIARKYEKEMESFFEEQREKSRRHEQDKARASYYSFTMFMVWLLQHVVTRAQEQYSLTQNFTRTQVAPRNDAADEAA